MAVKTGTRLAPFFSFEYENIVYVSRIKHPKRICLPSERTIFNALVVSRPTIDSADISSGVRKKWLMKPFVKKAIKPLHTIGSKSTVSTCQVFLDF